MSRAFTTADSVAAGLGYATRKYMHEDQRDALARLRHALSHYVTPEKVAGVSPHDRALLTDFVAALPNKIPAIDHERVAACVRDFLRVSERPAWVASS